MAIEIEESILEDLTDQEQTQVRHYVESLEKSGALTEEAIHKAVEKYASGLRTYRQTMQGMEATGPKRRASTTRQRKAG